MAFGAVRPMLFQERLTLGQTYRGKDFSPLVYGLENLRDRLCCKFRPHGGIEG